MHALEGGSLSAHRKFTLIFWLAAAGIMVTSYLLLDRSQSNLIRSKSLLTAEIVANQVLVDRQVYTQSLVQKLEREGAGASVEAHKREGYIPLPAQFVRAVSEKIKSNEDRLYEYSLISEWNLNREQGLSSEFERQAWQELKAQEVRFQRKNMAANWKPVTQFMEGRDGLELRYMRADLATAEACVSCHNMYEQRPDIMTFREAAGVTPGKVWQRGELMGAIHVTVPLKKFEDIAVKDRLALLLALLAACLIGFLMLYRLIYVRVIRPVEEEADAKTRFLARMSHEIRTPLNAVINMAKFLGEEGLTKSQQEHLRVIDSSAEHLLGVVNDILDFSKLEADGVVCESIPFDLRKLMKSITAAGQPAANEKGVDLSLLFGKGVPDIVSGDPLRLRQVLQNLVSNSVKFTEKGSVQLSVKQREGAHILFTVQDTGEGIPEHRQSAIFDDFTQADDTTTRRHGGTGLGLTICKGLINLMGGAISLESEVGIGTTIWFELELPAASLKPDAKQDLFESEQRFDGVEILLAEDNPINQVIARTVLESWGATVRVAANGQEAVDYMANNPEPALVLMDSTMPVLNGTEAAAEIRRLGKKVPIIAVSAAVLEEEQQACFDAGMDAFVAKPLDRTTLNKHMARLLGRQ